MLIQYSGFIFRIKKDNNLQFPIIDVIFLLRDFKNRQNILYSISNIRGLIIQGNAASSWQPQGIVQAAFRLLNYFPPALKKVRDIHGS